MPAGRPVCQLHETIDSIAAMRVAQDFGGLMESGSLARAADTAFLDSALELYPEDQDHDLATMQNSSADLLHTVGLKRQRQRFYDNTPRTKAKQTTNE